MEHRMRDDECMPKHKCKPCHRRCVGTYTSQHRIYEKCCCEVCKVCSCCGNEYDDSRYEECPTCGAPPDFMAMGDPPTDDPPRFGGFGGFGGFGFFPFFSFFPLGQFRRFRRF